MLGDANDDMQLDMAAVDAFLAKHGEEPVLLFGFTSIVWLHFFEALRSAGARLSMPGSVLIHGGGWKKMEALNVDNDIFKAQLSEVCGIEKVHNYYGMTCTYDNPIYPEKSEVIRGKKTAHCR